MSFATTAWGGGGGPFEALPATVGGGAFPATAGRFTSGELPPQASHSEDRQITASRGTA